MEARARRSSFVLLCVSLCATAQAQRPSLPTRQEIAPRVDSLIRSFLATDGPSGVSVAVVRAGDTLAFQGWGLADRALHKPATAATTYRIGSITKQFTAAAIMRLVERKRLALSDTIGGLLPRLPAAWRGVTLLQLLNHTGGLPDYAVASDRWNENVPPDTLVSFVARDTLHFAPGQKWEYSNTDYLLLGMVAEKLYGRGYAQIIRDEFAKPLDLAQTRYCEDADGANGQAIGYRRSGTQLEAPAYRHISQPFASGALCSTIGDIVKWNRALHNGRVVSPASYALMTTPQGAATAGSYGFGLRAVSIAGRRAIMHSGSTTGFITTNAWFPAESLSITILANTAPLLPQEQLLMLNLTQLALGLQLSTLAPDVALDSIALSRYVGRYTLDVSGHPLAIRFWIADGRLVAQPDGQRAVSLRPVREHVFVAVSLGGHPKPATDGHLKTGHHR